MGIEVFFRFLLITVNNREQLVNSFTQQSLSKLVEVCTEILDFPLAGCQFMCNDRFLAGNSP